MATVKTSPRGIAHYPHVNTPDYKFDADGKFHVKLKMDSEEPEVAALIEWIDSEHEASKADLLESLINPGDGKKGLTPAAAAKKVKDGDKPYVYVEDEDGEETSEVLFNFTMKAHIKVKKTGKEFNLKPKFFDAAGKLIKSPPSVYGGSTLRVSYTPQRWGTIKLGASVRFRMEAIQIINLVTGGGSDNAKDYGFGAEEGGYEAPEEESMPADDDDANQNPGGDADDDGTGDF